MAEEKNSFLFWTSLLLVGGTAIWIIDKRVGNQKSNNNNVEALATQSYTNAATQAGMPYSLDLTKVITIQNPSGLLITVGGIVYNDSTGKWSNLMLRKLSDGYYLYSGNVAYVYDLNTGAFIKTVPFTQSQINSINGSVNAATAAGMPYSIDPTKAIGGKYLSYTYAMASPDCNGCYIFQGVNDNCGYYYAPDGSFIRVFNPNDNNAM